MMPDDEQINPFGASPGTGWVDELGPDWWKQKMHQAPPTRDEESYPRDRKPHAILVRLADIPPEPINWLWPGRIALGKLTLIAGDPGLGKSLLATTLGACVSKGYPWPICNVAAPLGDVVLLSAEDDPADTIRPRLDAAGADCTRVHILKAVQEVGNDGLNTQRTFSLRRDLDVLQTVLTDLPECKLVVIDPISAYLDGTDSHNNSDVRGLLAPLAEAAARHQIAILLVHHLNKNGMGNALYRTMGSLAFVAAVRTAHIVTKDKDDSGRRLFMPMKNNLANDSTGLAYSVMASEAGNPVIAWETEPVTITAEEALAPSDSGEERTETDWAVTVLEEMLSNAPLPALEIKKQARSAGIGDKALRRAREKLGVITRKSDFKGGWEWTLPGHEDAQDAPYKTEGILGTEGHLGDEAETV